MKSSIQFATLLLIPLTLPAQKHIYDDLLVLYVDEAYGKCIAKAERYATKDDTRRDPLPFLYLSMCNHEMSLKEEYQTQHAYRFADRDALKYAVRFRKKDKDLEFFGNYEDYWMSLNTQAMERGIHHYELGEYGRARRIFDRMVAYMPENPGAWRMRALCQVPLNQMREAEESRKGFEQAHGQVADLGRLPQDQRTLIRYALVAEAEELLAKGEADKAREVLSLGEETFMGNTEFKALFRELN